MQLNNPSFPRKRESRNVGCWTTQLYETGSNVAIDTDLRYSAIAEVLNSSEAKDSRGAICIGLDLEHGDLPYSLVALSPLSNLFDEAHPSVPVS